MDPHNIDENELLTGFPWPPARSRIWWVWMSLNER